ncbi:hypothetical protein N7510_011662 [Penicillium lagena]|uniref:uncharacterized protein n=1 Tax=Penicillium lagena TaxID=94218 RepID=UPI002540AC16|nr:uncharacterized protein N7510_011662 [Penicillium lagena]KAJ5602128.1 hypothetical protein N7510_011662 [Penicillium lagena]
MLPRAVSSILLTICLVILALDQHCAASVLKKRSVKSHTNGATSPPFTPIRTVQLSRTIRTVQPSDIRILESKPSGKIPFGRKQIKGACRPRGSGGGSPTISKKPTITNAAGVQTAPPEKGASTITCGTQGPIQAMGLSAALCLCPSGDTTYSLPVLTIPLSSGYGPKASFTWSNNTVPAGDFDDPDTNYTPTKKKRDNSPSVDVSAVTKRLFDGLVADGGPCAATSGGCDSTKSLVFDNVATTTGDGVDGEEVDFLKLTFIVDDSSFDDEYIRNEMLVAGLTMWALVTSKNCQNITYKADADDTGSGCGQGPVHEKRSPVQLLSPLEMDKRSPISPGSDGNIESGHMSCTYEARVCQAPDSFHVVNGPHDDPYKYWLDIQVKSELEGGGGVTCKELLGVTEAAIVVLGWWNPELAASAQVQVAKFIAMCSLAQTAVNALKSGSVNPKDYIPLLENVASFGTITA